MQYYTLQSVWHCILILIFVFCSSLQYMVLNITVYCKTVDTKFQCGIQ